MCPRWAASGERGEEEEGALLSLYHSEGTSIVGCVYVRFHDILQSILSTSKCICVYCVCLFVICMSGMCDKSN